MNKIIKQIPNLITLSRMISCVLGVIFFALGNLPVALGCYVYGAVSDACDGFVARKLNAVTELGKKLDPISDKLYALSLMAPAIACGNYFMTIPFVLEGIISGINIYAEKKYKKTHTELVGKIKTIALFPTMILGLVSAQIPSLYVYFVPALLASSALQVGSVKAYYNQLQNFKTEAIDSNIGKNILNGTDNSVFLSKSNELVQTDIKSVIAANNYAVLPNLKPRTRKPKSRVLRKPKGEEEGKKY